MNSRAVFPYMSIAPPGQWLYKNENTARTVTDIFRIGFLYVSRAHRKRFQMVTQHLVWIFIHADYRDFRIIRQFIEVPNILHVGYKICVFLWRDTPVFILVGVKFVFLKHGEWFPAQPAPQAPSALVVPKGAESTGICLPVPVHRQCG